MEDAALSLLALDPDVSAVGHGDLAADCEAKTAAADGAATGTVHPVEAVEEVLARLRRDARAVVAHRDAHLVDALPALDPHAAPAGREFERILHEIRQRLVQALGVGL